MKTITSYLFFLLLWSFSSGSSDLIAQDSQTSLSAPASEERGAYIDLEETVFDFGTIQTGDIIKHDFPFKNTGNEALILFKISTTCGCTAPEWPRDPIPPGETGEISIRFDSKGKIGSQNKIVTVLSNALNESVILSLRGVVKDSSPPRGQKK
ncbi:MAG: DUF1573 domain-containing protein [Cytophagales bacterium]|nr:DUF1573 domain-containing protein [Cytophagales bacterium]